MTGRAIAIPASRPERVARLDEAAFTAFYGRTSRGLWAYVHRITGQAADAEDIVQEAFCRLLRIELADDEEQRRRYLYRVASNLVIDRWRGAGRAPGEIDEEALAAVATPAHADGGDVARTFATLTARDRALLWLAYVEEESHEEIAESLGVGRRSVKVLLFRAKRRLRDLLTSRGITPS